MTPRRYDMSARAEQAAKTRERILDAALSSYREVGVTATSLQGVARRAGVSPATILNHFGGADELARTVVERLTVELHIPDDSGWSERGRRARMRRMVREMFAFYERSRPLFDVFRAELRTAPALREGEAAYRQSVGDLYARVFGDALSDDRARAAVVGLTSPATFVALRDAGMSVADAAELVGDSLDRVLPDDGVEPSSSS